MNPQVYLREHPILSRASDAALLTVARSSEVKSHATGARVVRPQAQHAHVIVLISGSFRLTQKNRAERTEVLLGTVAAPAIFGDAELAAGARWNLYAVAAEPTVAVWIENAAYIRFIAQDARLAFAMYQDASARHLLTVELMQVFALQSLTNRVLRLLWSASQEDAAGKRTSPMNQQELARALGVNRKTIARHLQRMEETGLLKRGARSVTILAGPRDAFADRPLQQGLGAQWRLKGA